MIAHQGGWDEILLVLGPIVVVGGLLRLAKRRVERAAQQVAPPATVQADEPPDDASTRPRG